jgi:hypothetical protein
LLISTALSSAFSTTGPHTVTKAASKSTVSLCGSNRNLEKTTAQEVANEDFVRSSPKVMPGTPKTANLLISTALSSAFSTTGPHTVTKAASKSTVSLCGNNRNLEKTTTQEVANEYFVRSSPKVMPGNSSHLAGSSVLSKTQGSVTINQELNALSKTMDQTSPGHALDSFSAKNCCDNIAYSKCATTHARSSIANARFQTTAHSTITANVPVLASSSFASSINPMHAVTRPVRKSIASASGSKINMENVITSEHFEDDFVPSSPTVMPGSSSNLHASVVSNRKDTITTDRERNFFNSMMDREYPRQGLNQSIYTTLQRNSAFFRMWIATIASNSQKEDADIFKVIKSVRSHHLEKLKRRST